MRVLATLIASSLIFSSLVSCLKKGDQEASSASDAADNRKVTFIYGPINRSITIGQVKTFVATGEAQGDIDTIIRFGKLNKNDVRGLLAKSISMDLSSADKLLNSSVGEALLEKVGTAIHPRHAKGASVQAIRGAVIASLGDDGAMSFVEVLRNLPVDMAVEVPELMALRPEIGAILP